jgi:hypothetical protein
MKKKLITLLATIILMFPALANDDEIIEYLDFFENMELVEDDNFEEIVDDQNGISEALDENKEKKKEEEENV